MLIYLISDRGTQKKLNIFSNNIRNDTPTEYMYSINVLPKKDCMLHTLCNGRTLREKKEEERKTFS